MVTMTSLSKNQITDGKCEKLGWSNTEVLPKRNISFMEYILVSGFVCKGIISKTNLKDERYAFTAQQEQQGLTFNHSLILPTVARIKFSIHPYYDTKIKLLMHKNVWNVRRSL